MYKRATENPALASLFFQYKIAEKHFNAALRVEKQRKQSDLIPDLTLDGEVVGHPGYHLVKLPIDDPRAYILGHITNCCQSMGGHSEACVIDGITREHNAFYVLLKRKKPLVKKPPLQEGKINYADYDIVGEGYVWLSKMGNLTFDSWENLRPENDNPIIVSMLQEFAKQVTMQHLSILRVTIGESLVKYPEVMREGYQYQDSREQGLLYINKEKLALMQQRLLHRWQESVLPVNNETEFCRLIATDDCYSHKHSELFEGLIFAAQARLVWQDLLGEKFERLSELQQKIDESGLAFWEVLFQLLQSEKLNRENFNALLS